MCKDTPQAQKTQEKFNVRGLAKVLVEVQAEHPGAVLEFGQRKDGEIHLTQEHARDVIMWPIARESWPFIADTKPLAISMDEGLSQRWGLEGAEIVRCEMVPGELRPCVLRVRDAIEERLRAHGVPCTFRMATKQNVMRVCT
jgi:hypothetical protein